MKTKLSSESPHSDRLENALRQLPEAVFLFDFSGYLVFVNEKAAALEPNCCGSKTLWELFRFPDAKQIPICIDDLADLAPDEIGGLLQDGTAVTIKPSRVQSSNSDSHLLILVRPTVPMDWHRQQRMLARISSELISVARTDVVLDNVVRLMLELAELDHATITTVDEENANFVVEVEYPVLSEQSLIGRRIPIKGLQTQEALLKSRTPVVAPDLAHHQVYLESPDVQKYARNLGIQSMLIVPMVCKGLVIGTVSLDAIHNRREFTPAEIEIYQTIADQTALAIANSSMFENAMRWKQQYCEVYSAASLKGVGEKILKDVLAIVECRKASVQLVIDGRRVLISAHGFDRDKASPRLLGRIEFDPIVKEIVETKKIRVIADTTLESAWTRQPETEDVNSWIGIPIVWGKESNALITLDHDKCGFYGQLSEENLTDLQRLADAAAVDIQSAYLFDAAERQIKAFELVQRIAEIVATELNKDDLLGRVTREIAQSLQCDCCSVFLEGNDPIWLSEHARWPLGDAPPHQVNVVGTNKLTRSPLIQAFHSGETVLIGDFFDPPTAERYELGIEFPLDTQSLLAIPISMADKTIGVMAVSHSQINKFSASDALWLETIVRHVAIAIERDTGLDIIQEVGRNILQATEIGGVLRQIVQGAIKLTHAATGVIYVLSDDGRAIEGSYFPDGSRHPVPRLHEERGITRRIIDHKKGIEIPDIKTDPHVHPEIGSRYSSMVAIPVLLNDRVIGVLCVNDTRARSLTEIERWFLYTLADQAALAIQRMRLDQQFRDSIALYRSLVDHIPQCVFQKDLKSKFTWVNNQFCKTLAKTKEEIHGKTDRDFYPLSLADSYVEDDRRVLNGDLVEKTEWHFSKELEKDIRVKVVKTPLRDAASKIIGVQAIFWDVTEEEELKERYRELVRQSPDGIVVHKNGQISLANPAAARLFGVVSEDSLIGRSVFEFVDSPYQPIARERLGMLMSNEAVEEMIEMRVLRNEEKVDVAVYARSLPGNTEVQVVLRDLEPYNLLLRDMQHRVRKALNELSRYLGLARRNSSRPEVDRAFRAMDNRIQAMALVHESLHAQFGKTDIPVEDYLTRLVDAVFASHGREGGFVTFNVAAPEVQLDGETLKDCGIIVAELVSNSLLYAFPDDRPGQVSISLSEVGGEFVLIVSDDGIGYTSAPQPNHRSIGTYVIKKIAELRLKGQLQFDLRREKGVEVVLRFNGSKNGESP